MNQLQQAINNANPTKQSGNYINEDPAQKKRTTKRFKKLKI